MNPSKIEAFKLIASNMEECATLVIGLLVQEANNDGHKMSKSYTDIYPSFNDMYGGYYEPGYELMSHCTKQWCLYQIQIEYTKTKIAIINGNVHLKCPV